MIRKTFMRLQTLYLMGRLRINSAMGLPAQTSKDIQIFKKVFDTYAKGKKIRIFEWGSGLSTIYYTDYLRRKGISAEWHSIDNNKLWHEKVKSIVKRKKLDGYVHLHLKEFVPFWQKPGWGILPPPCGVFGPKSENEIAYINFPMQFGIKFDVVIIDARFRRHCIQTAGNILLPDGVAILHDAQKEHYHAGLDSFKHGLFIDTGAWYPFQAVTNKLWVGSINNNMIVQAVKQL